MTREVSYSRLFSQEIIELISDKSPIILDMSISKDKFYIDVEKIANQLGLKISYVDCEPEESGSIVDNAICVNEKHHKNRQRFTIAHEIGHYLLNHEGKNHRTNDISKYTNNQLVEERKANDIAAQILMPKVQMEAIYIKFLEINDLDNQDKLTLEQKDRLFDYIADKMFVSKSAASYRLLNLGIV
ncbi:hypothetical protein DOS68_02500 [Staphylococcus felis]|uniref:ImmA/IrrE family metallo-endopeptidase n=1 Tax=Staphylococcus felis TaxID=46127 RepID=UPI000E262F61|nr:ImmA/IrrE family metallo-endopeptidase [Staphylococcus felis]REH91765.1 hypothetical protein DOS68_02500 [Staphylococcus felis]REI29501.1 hypothetical protein DOS81_06370 [Staphylococcus felis]